ncbi:MAG: deoxynucleoside kinase, partial [Myxococcota bacterium]
RAVLESLDDNPFLADFYQDPERNALPTQLFFLMSRFQQQEQLAQGDLFAQTTIADYIFDKDRLFALQNLRGEELGIYEDLFSVLEPQVPKPDLVIHLRADIDEIMRRIADRGRSYERNMDAQYIERLAVAYHAFFARFDRCPVLTLDTSAVDLRADQAALAEVVKAVRTGRPPATIPSEVTLGETPLLPGLD